MKIIAAMLAMFGAVVLTTSAAFAGPSREEMGREVKVPDTAADHAALAKHYDEKAAEWQRDAEYHEGMAAAYKKSSADPKDAVTMEKHCAKLAKDAKDMAKEAKLMADYHRLRGKESK